MIQPNCMMRQVTSYISLIHHDNKQSYSYWFCMAAYSMLAYEWDYPVYLHVNGAEQLQSLHFISVQNDRWQLEAFL